MTEKTRENRSWGDEGTVPLQGRVRATTRPTAKEAARDLGVSMGAYLEMLVEYDAEHHVVRPTVTHVQEALTA